MIQGHLYLHLSPSHECHPCVFDITHTWVTNMDKVDLESLKQTSIAFLDKFSSLWMNTPTEYWVPIQYTYQNMYFGILIQFSIHRKCKRFNVINCMHRFLILYYRPLYFKYTLCDLRLQAAIAILNYQRHNDEYEKIGTVFLIILQPPRFLLEIRVIIKISKNPWYPINCD